jgi:Family of unknown function (DUF5989)
VQGSTLSKSGVATRTNARRKRWISRLLADVLFVARRDRKLLLLPLVLLLLVLAAFIVVGTALGPLAPFIYPLF